MSEVVMSRTFKYVVCTFVQVQRFFVEVRNLERQNVKIQIVDMEM
jgi:hypothetical protein